MVQPPTSSLIWVATLAIKSIEELIRESSVSSWDGLFARSQSAGCFVKGCDLSQQLFEMKPESYELSLGCKHALGGGFKY